MIVVSAGMRKAGSLWLYQITNDLLVKAGAEDVSTVEVSAPARSFVIVNRARRIKCGRLNAGTVARLSMAAAMGDTYPVKTHSGPSPTLRLAQATGLVKATYIYRDPRDVALSVLDHGVRAREDGDDIDLAHISTPEQALDLAEREVKRWEAWARFPGALIVRYEDMVADPLSQVERLNAHLGFDHPQAFLEEVVQRYQRKSYEKNEPTVHNKIHFNKGVAGRYQTDMEPEILAQYEARLGPYLDRMGYPRAAVAA